MVDYFIVDSLRKHHICIFGRSIFYKKIWRQFILGSYWANACFFHLYTSVSFW